MAENYKLVIFYDDTTKFDVDLLKEEASLVQQFQISELNLTSPKGYMDGIRYHCKVAGQCVVTDHYGGSIVRLSKPPVCFFQLRKWLLELGYNNVARDISWETDETCKQNENQKSDLGSS